MRRGFRYDPLYRVIDEPDELRVLEGRFRDLCDRLKHISNLGIIPRVFEMAKYPKYEHMVGTVHQVNSLLSVVDSQVIPERYRKPLLVAAIFMHLGHLPLTYSSERALLLAGSLGDRSSENRVKRYVRRRVQRALSAAGYGDDVKQSVLNRLFSMHNYRRLYRYFSAQLLADNWNRVAERVEGLTEDGLSIAVKDLIDPDCVGYKYLQMADEADFVQRDGLYFGTIKIDLAPRHLYSQISSSEPDVSLSERRLIEYNRRYLAEKFYENREVVGFTRLYEKILAGLIMSSRFKLEWLENYDDNHLERLICDNFDKANNRTRLPNTWTSCASQLLQGSLDFRYIFRLDGVDFGAGRDVIDIEYHLIGRRESETGILRYPFQTGMLLSVDYDDHDRWLRLSDHELFSVVVFQDQENRQLAELLKVADRLQKNLSALHHTAVLREAVGELLSWTEEIRIDSTAVLRRIGSAISSLETKDADDSGQFVRRYLQSLTKIATYGSLWDDSNNFFWRAVLVDRSFEAPIDNLNPERRREYFVEGLMGLPVRLLQYQSTAVHLTRIYAELLAALATDLPRDEKGDIFEALWLVQSMRSRRGSYQLFINGLVVIDSRQPAREQDEHEYDVIELLINDEGRAECHIYACSIAENYRQNNRDALGRLADHLHDSFPELAIHTYYVKPTSPAEGNWQPRVEDAGRNYL